jgi:hypothetical protein
MFITIWSQKLLCNCKGHYDAMWGHDFAIIINMITCPFLDKYIIIFKFILIYLNDLKSETEKYHLLLQLIVTNNDSILMMMMWHSMCQQSVTTSNQFHDS